MVFSKGHNHFPGEERWASTGILRSRGKSVLQKAHHPPILAWETWAGNTVTHGCCITACFQCYFSWQLPQNKTTRQGGLKGGMGQEGADTQNLCWSELGSWEDKQLGCFSFSSQGFEARELQQPALPTDLSTGPHNLRDLGLQQPAFTICPFSQSWRSWEANRPSVHVGVKQNPNHRGWRAILWGRLARNLHSPICAHPTGLRAEQNGDLSRTRGQRSPQFPPSFPLVRITGKLRHPWRTLHLSKYTHVASST